MQACISRSVAAQLTLVGTRVGAKVAKAVLMSAAAGRLTPEIVGEALMSSSTVRGHVQREAVRLLVVRVSMRTPGHLQWLLHLIGDCVGGLSASDALSSLTRRSLFYQVTSFGMRGSAASAITTAALQVGVTTCTLLTSNAAFWGDRDRRMSLRQYRYEVLTSLYTSVGTVAGGAAGAAVGSMVMPGIGTAFGSVLASVGGGYVPGYIRARKGPDDRRRQQASELRGYTPLRMYDTPEGAVMMSAEELAEETPAALPTPAGADFVLLDFVRPNTPAAAASDAAGLTASAEDSDEGGSEATLMRSCVRFSPALARLSHEGAASGAGDGLTCAGATAALDADGEAAVSSITSLASTVSLRGGDVADTQTATQPAASTERFRGTATYVTACTADELECELEKCGGEDDVLFVFA
ncbi:hypothetical protein NESM_000480300 [Novymonas esmeraldas]|uniref:Uncharacterized protein n=1 Tax=Novymonas esmeraldas TaxID=1808958 RepID=A0AAW0EMW2_9TRYP